MVQNLHWLKPGSNAERAGDGRYVRAARVLVPVIAAALLALTIVWAQLNPEAEVKKIDLKDVQNKVDTARFTSVDEKGNPYVIEADRVVQQDPSTMTATLARPKGAITLKKGDVLSVQATDGVYDNPNQKLHLKGDVVLQQNKDMTFKTQDLDVNLQDKSAVGTSPVAGSSTNGDALHAQGVTLTPNASVLQFKGPATLTLMPRNKQETKP